MHYLDKPLTIQLEISSNCNLCCTGCCRVDNNTYDIKPNEYIPKNKFLDIDKFKSVLDDPIGTHFKKVEFCGTIDDPLMHPKFLNYLELLNEKQISCQVHTNASLRTPDYWKEIAYLTKKNPHSMVKFSIDGLHDTNHLYRRGSNWEKIMENAQAFIDAGGRAWWQYIVFDWNKHQVALARKLARKMGFDAFKYRHDRSWSPSSEEAKKIFETTSPKKYTKLKHYWRARAEKVNPIANLEINCFAQEEKYYFIGHNGEVWPCCFLMNANWSPLVHAPQYRQRFIDNYGKNWNNIYYRTFSEILKSDFYSADLVDSWKSREHGVKCKDRLIRCTETCSVKKRNANPIGNHETLTF